MQIPVRFGRETRRYERMLAAFKIGVNDVFNKVGWFCKFFHICSLMENRRFIRRFYSVNYRFGDFRRKTTGKLRPARQQPSDLLVFESEFFKPVVGCNKNIDFAHRQFEKNRPEKKSETDGSSALSFATSKDTIRIPSSRSTICIRPRPRRRRRAPR